MDLFYSDYMLHRHCLLGDAWVIMGMSLSDIVIAIAYAVISCGMAYIELRLPHMSDYKYLHRLFRLFGLFILLCGATHALSFVTMLWSPIYRVSAVVWIACALVSAWTALYFVTQQERIANDWDGFYGRIIRELE